MIHWETIWHNCWIYTLNGLDPIYNPKEKEGGEMCAMKKAQRQTSENAWLSLWQGVRSSLRNFPQIYVHPASCCANAIGERKQRMKPFFVFYLYGGCTRLCLWERETLVCTRPYVSVPLWYAVQQFNSNYSRNWNQKPLLTIRTVSWMSLKDFFLGNETNHSTTRHEICQNFYTARFSGQKFYTLYFTEFQQLWW